MNASAFHTIALHSERIECIFSPIGASIVDVTLLMSDGKKRQVALSPLTHLSASPDPSLAGRTVAPCCGRVRDAEIVIDGQRSYLDRNEGTNHIHGGFQGTALQTWNIERVTDRDLIFMLKLPDGLGGYPGDRTIRAHYRVENTKLSVHYSCITNKPTWFDITNHVYWDLSGRFDGSAMDQFLQVSARSHVRNDEHHLPVSVNDVSGTCFDFTHPVAPTKMTSAFPMDDQLQIGRGFNNALILDPKLVRANGFTAKLSDPNGEVAMLMHTDRPCLVFYSGGFLGADTPLAQGPSVPGAALALEAQSVPDPFHLSGAHADILRPGAEFSCCTAWEFLFT